jgi:two-component system chemotaxis response regulator CheY
VVIISFHLITEGPLAKSAGRLLGATQFRATLLPDAMASVQSGKSVLVVEDEQDLRDALRELLAMHGYSITLAKDGSEALTALGAMQELPGLILLDLMMPQMTGYQLMAALKGDPRYQAIPIVIVSALQAKQEDGVAEVVRKPFDIAVLLDIVGRHCRAPA